MTNEQKVSAYQAMINAQKKHIANLEQKIVSLEEANLDLEAHLHSFERDHYLTIAYFEGFISADKIGELLGIDPFEFQQRLDRKAAQGLKYVQQERPTPSMKLELVDEELDQYEGGW